MNDSKITVSPGGARSAGAARIAARSEPAIPVEALANHIAILGKTGSGKSNAAKTVVEGLLDRGERVCVLDPTGTWFGLRLTRKGKPSPYPIVIFGGVHADIPIGGAHGAAIAETVGTTTTPAVIDTRLLSVADRTRFFTDFAEALLRKNRGALTLVIDEAHLFAPKGKINDPRAGAMLGAANNLVSLGRGIGLRIILISQRPAKLHNDSLGQVETLVAMRMILPHDREAVMDWVREQADPGQGREIVASLPSLPTGDAWIWAPGLGLLERRHFPLAGTFDSGSVSDGVNSGPELAPLDIEAVTERLKTVAADVVANDPKALKAEIVRLKAEVARKPQTVAAEPDPAAIKRAEDAAFLRGVEEGERRGNVAGQAVMLARAQGALGGLKVDAAPEAVARPVARPVPAPAPPRQTSVPPRPARSEPVASGEVPAGCSKPLASLAGVYPAGMTEAQWALAAGYKRNGGTWGTYKSRLRGAGLIEQRDGRWFATESGAAAAGDVEQPPPPGSELVRWWASRLPGTTKIAEALIEAWPRDLGRDELADAVGMSAAGGSFGTYLSRLASPGLIERDGGVIRLTPEAMGAGG